MKIGISDCEWTKWDDKYPTTFVDDLDFYVYVGPTIDLIYDPIKNINMYKMAHVMTFIMGSAHEEYDDFDGPLDYPKYNDDFIIFKNSEVGRKAYKKYIETGNISQVLCDMKITPTLIQANVVLARVHPNKKPTITWGNNDN